MQLLQAIALLPVLWLIAVTVIAAEPSPGQNRLAFETSPYLLQHADNPVHWYPWGEAAFEKARREDKFIFLSVGYSTCHWCHVMNRESFSDPEIARLLNEVAVSVKVDREERPGVDAVYMQALRQLTGRGGWPMNLLLTPELEPFFAAIYLPPERLRAKLEEAHTLWTEERERILRRAERVMTQLRQDGGPAAAVDAALPGLARLDAAVSALAGTFDPFDGGFGPPPRFPLPSNLQLLITHHELTGAQTSLDMLTTTLDAMAYGGIFDQLGGGFHRYATDPQWRIPHFEKMLYDNAQLLHVYTRAWRLTGREPYRRVVEATAAWVQREMTGPDGLFHAAIDAEVAGEEGASYVWTRDQLQSVLSAQGLELAMQVWGLEGPPDLGGSHVLYWPRDPTATAQALDISATELQQRLEPIRAKLLSVRMQRPQPHIDDKNVTAWNGMMIEALAVAGRALERRDYVERAARAADALLELMRDDDGRLLHVARGGQARIEAYLDDYAAVILGLLALDRADEQTRWARAAARLGDAMIARLQAPAGDFRYAPATASHLILQPRARRDAAMPAPNSLAARALTGLARQVDARFAAPAAAILRAFAPVVEAEPDAMPHLLWALAEYRAAGLDAAGAAAADYVPPDTADVLQVGVRGDAADPRRVILTLQLEPGWHVNANPAALEFLIPTRIRSDAPGFVPVVDYPPGRPLEAGFERPVQVYDDGVRIPLRLPRRAPAGLTLKLQAQACSDDGRCLAPAEVPVPIPAGGQTDAREGRDAAP